MSLMSFRFGERLTQANRRFILSVLVSLFLAVAPAATADDFVYGGVVTAGDGGLGTLIPIGSPISGPIGITTTPGGSTTNTGAITDALLLMTNQDTGVVLFCFFLNTVCPPVGSQVPITAITAVNLNFANDGCPTTGTIDLLAFSPTFELDIPVTLNLTSGTFHAESAGLGFVDGIGSLDCMGPDSDGDAIADHLDNCSLIANADQRDTNGDSFGNACDPDLDNNGVVNFGDVSMWVPFFNMATTGDADFNGDGFANFGDYSLIPSFFQQPPGPSGTAPDFAAGMALYDADCASCHEAGVYDTTGNFGDIAGTGSQLVYDLGDISGGMNGLFLSDQDIVDLTEFLDDPSVIGMPR